jgi:membrane dipeptidase
MKIIDLHCDTIGEVQAGKNLLRGIPESHVDIPRMQSGNAGLIVFASFISSILPSERALRSALELLELTNQTCTDFSEYLTFVDSSYTLEKVLQSDKIGILPAIENGYAINNDISNLERFRILGVRYMTLTHAKNLEWAASSGEKSCDFEGLTEFGVKVVHAMNEFGMIVDVSHVHETTFWDVVKNSKKPFIASHSNAQKICPIPRNLNDDQIKAIAESGGMIGINFFPGFLDLNYMKNLEQYCGDLFNAFDQVESKYIDDPVKKNNALHKFFYELQLRMTEPHVGIEKVLEHIEYVINLVGDDYVGIGSDFDGVPSLPEGISGCDIYTDLIKLLQNKFQNQKTVEKIAFKNFQRVLKENE